jgi:hypothetical protein
MNSIPSLVPFTLHSSPAVAWEFVSLGSVIIAHLIITSALQSHAQSPHISASFDELARLELLNATLPQQQDQVDAITAAKDRAWEFDSVR